MSKIKIGVIEDEVITADSLCSTLSQLGYDVSEPAATFAEALVMIEEEKPDLLLLDIQIKGKRDGIELASKLNETYRLPFIFLTANADEATVQRAKHTSPGAYLLKPFTRNDLYTAIEICLHNTLQLRSNSLPCSSICGPPRDFVFVKDGATFYKVRFSDVLYLESEHVYVKLHTREKQYLVRSSLQSFLSHFDKEKFFRIHRSYVINLDHLQSVSADQVSINGVCLPLGRTYQEELFTRLNIT